MAKKPEYLKFADVDAGKRKTRVVEVRSLSSGVLLGRIAWYGPWRQYTLWPAAETIFNVGCLESIVDRCSRMNVHHRDELRRAKARG